MNNFDKKINKISKCEVIYYNNIGILNISIDFSAFNNITENDVKGTYD